MNSNGKHTQARDQYGFVTQLLAGACHKCKICPYADKKPDAAFGRLMRWHRSWCPAWAAHITVFGAGKSGVIS